MAVRSRAAGLADGQLDREQAALLGQGHAFPRPARQVGPQILEHPGQLGLRDVPGQPRQQVVQGAAVVTIVLNIVALWKQERVNPMSRAEREAPRPAFADAWRDLTGQGAAARLLVGDVDDSGNVDYALSGIFHFRDREAFDTLRTTVAKLTERLDQLQA